MWLLRREVILILPSPRSCHLHELLPPGFMHQRRGERLDGGSSVLSGPFLRAASSQDRRPDEAHSARLDPDEKRTLMRKAILFTAYPGTTLLVPDQDWG